MVVRRPTPPSPLVSYRRPSKSQLQALPQVLLHIILYMLGLIPLSHDALHFLHTTLEARTALTVGLAGVDVVGEGGESAW